MSARHKPATDQSPRLQNRREAITAMAALPALSILSGRKLTGRTAASPQGNKKWDKSVERGLAWLAKQQQRLGGWGHDVYPIAISSLAATALICSGSTTTQGPYAKNIRLAADYLMTKCRKNGLIGDPRRDDRYTYGHGFAMLFLSQVLGEEEDILRRQELIEILDRSIKFSVNAQTKAGGWGYVSGRDDNSSPRPQRLSKRWLSRTQKSDRRCDQVHLQVPK